MTCAINLHLTMQWITSIYLAIGFLFAAPGLFISIYNCHHEHTFIHFCSHMQSFIVQLVTWPVTVMQIRRVTKMAIEEAGIKIAKEKVSKK